MTNGDFFQKTCLQKGELHHIQLLADSGWGKWRLTYPGGRSRTSGVWCADPQLTKIFWVSTWAVIEWCHFHRGTLRKTWARPGKAPPEACLVRVQGVKVFSTSERSSHRVQKTWNPRHRSSLTNTCGFGKRGPHEKMAQEWDTPMYPRNWSFCHYLYQYLTTITYMLK